MIRERNYFLWTGFGMFLFLIVIMFFGSYLPKVDPGVHKELVRFKGDKILVPPYNPSWDNLLGTDENGRDLLSLIVMGTRSTILMVIVTTFIRYLIAVPLGLFASKKHGPFHWLLNSLNQLFSTLPSLFFTILIVNLPFLVFNNHRLTWVIITIAFVEVGRVAYIIQQQAYIISTYLYIDVSKMIGIHPFKIYIHHYLPALIPEIAVNFFLDAARIMLLVGQLGIFSIFISQKWVQTSFGSGKLQDTSYNWATLLAQARTHIWTNIWLFLFPALAIIFTMMMFLFLGEGLRKLFNRYSG